MSNPNIMSDDEIHEFGINVVLDDVRKSGLTVLSVQTGRNSNPQIIVKNDNQIIHVLVRTACYPNKGMIESKQLCDYLFQKAKRANASCYVARIGIANANGTTDLEMSIPTRGAGFYVAYDGLEELTQEAVNSNKFTISSSIYNKHGEITGSVTKNLNGRHTIVAEKNADMNSILMSLCLIFANDLSENQRVIFSKWAHLPHDSWSPVHQQSFAQALLHYFMEAKVHGGKLPASVLKALQSFPPQALIELKYPLTQEIRNLFSSMFGG